MEVVRRVPVHNHLIGQRNFIIGVNVNSTAAVCARNVTHHFNIADSHATISADIAVNVDGTAFFRCTVAAKVALNLYLIRFRVDINCSALFTCNVIQHARLFIHHEISVVNVNRTAVSSGFIIGDIAVFNFYATVIDLDRAAVAIVNVHKIIADL